MIYIKINYKNIKIICLTLAGIEKSRTFAPSNKKY